MALGQRSRAYHCHNHDIVINSNGFQHEGPHIQSSKHNCASKPGEESSDTKDRFPVGYH